MKEWFLSREPRERVVLAAGAALAAVIVFWAFVWTPMRDGSTELRERVSQKTQLLVDLQRASALAPVEGDRPAPSAGTQSLVVLIDRTAQSHGVAGALTRTRPEGADAINVTVRDAAFDELVGWLVTLQTAHALTVESATFNGSRAPGLVNGQLLLRRR
ncbi:MAG: type II secretion system protein M [Gammaproteobacteria bacterium]|nr:type II secretion system protein M [Gammaproteobacteria bacterium]